MWADTAFVSGAYLYGSLPFVWAAAKLKGINLRQQGSGSISGSNLWQAVGVLEGMVGGFGDFSKGLLPVLVGRALGLNLDVICIGALAAVLGQCWPIFLKFSGGRGGSTWCGLGLVLAPIQFGIALVPWLSSVFWRNFGAYRASRAASLEERLRFKGAPTEIVPLGMFISVATLPALSWLWGQPPAITFTFVAAFIAIVIRRLTADIQKDIRQACNKSAILGTLTNRFLYDRSYRQ